MSHLKNPKLIPATGILLLVVVVGYFLWTAPDRRDTGEKIGDAINELQKGAENAVQQLEDRTPGEKIEDAAKGMKDDAQKSLNQE